MIFIGRKQRFRKKGLHFENYDIYFVQYAEKHCTYSHRLYRVTSRRRHAEQKESTELESFIKKQIMRLNSMYSNWIITN